MHGPGKDTRPPVRIRTCDNNHETHTLGVWKREAGTATAGPGRMKAQQRLQRDLERLEALARDERLRPRAGTTLTRQMLDDCIEWNRRWLERRKRLHLD